MTGPLGFLQPYQSGGGATRSQGSGDRGQESVKSRAGTQFPDPRLLSVTTQRPFHPARRIRVSHDSDPTFAFRIDAHDSPGLAWAVGYASDLGCGSDELVAAFAGVDVLALEYNHDVKLERRSPRPKFLVDRVLSDSG